MKQKTWLFAGLAALLPPAGAAATAAGLNVPVAARVVGFTQPAPAGPVAAAIVYDPANPASEAEADAILREIGAGLAIGRGVIHARKVPATALAGLSCCKVAFVTSGVRAQAQLEEIAARNAILTITSDIGCVKAGHCVVSVSNAPRTEIIISRAAAKASSVRFGSAFLMLVKEL